jgi:hypothetical protein
MKKDAVGYTKERHRKMMFEMLDQPARIQNAIKVSKTLKKSVSIPAKSIRLSALIKHLS